MSNPDGLHALNGRFVERQRGVVEQRLEPLGVRLAVLPVAEGVAAKKETGSRALREIF